MANKYVLQGNGIQIDYTIGGNPGFTALTFTEGGTHKNFTPAQVTTDHTGLARWSRWRWCSRSTPAARGSAFSCPTCRWRSDRVCR